MAVNRVENTPATRGNETRKPERTPPARETQRNERAAKPRNTGRSRGEVDTKA